MRYSYYSVYTQVTYFVSKIRSSSEFFVSISDPMNVYLSKALTDISPVNDKPYNYVLYAN